MSTAEPIIRVCGVQKSFAHVHALRGVDFELYAGEIVAIIGDNGAGKSTLANIIAGTFAPDEGWVEIQGKRIVRPTSKLVHDLGVQTVYQSLALGPDLSITENMFLGREMVGGSALHRALGVLDKKRMANETKKALMGVGVTLPSVKVCARDLSGGQRQSVAVARAVSWAKCAILMDEPTAALSAKQTHNTLEVIRAAPARGLGVVVISHDLPNMLTYADRIVVMRHGEVVAERRAESATVASLIGLMVGAQEEVV